MSTPSGPPPINRRFALAALGLGVIAPNLLAACAGSTLERAVKNPEMPAPELKFQPALNAPATSDVIPNVPVSVEVDNGWLQKVVLKNSAGKPVAGTFNADRTAYAITDQLGYAESYTWSGSAVGRDGKAIPVAGKFTTVTPTKKIGGAFQLADGQTVGVAAPIIIQFDAPIADKAAVEKALTITTTPPVEGSWAWLPDEAEGARVHYRTREYYPAGTTVNVQAKFFGLPFGDGAYGAHDLSLNFDIGRRQVVNAEVPSHRIQVIRDSGVIMEFPCSYGEADKARNVTRNGIHVVTEKYSDFYMSNPAAGYSNAHERWAVRISNNGEFIHANPASSGAQGRRNVTNGCINLSTANAAEYFRSAMYGDPVEVTGSSIQLSYDDGDIWDWAVDWNTWVGMSALAPSTHSPATDSPGLQAQSPSQIPVTAPAAPTTTTSEPTTVPTTTEPTTTEPTTTEPARPGG